MSFNLKVPEGVLAYAFNGGGLNNQKIALLGMFLKSLQTTSRRVILPNLLIFDQINFDHRPVSISDVLQLDALRAFATRNGIEIVNEDPCGDRGGWEYFHYGEDQIAGLAAFGELTTDSTAVQFFRAWSPIVSQSDALERLKAAVFERLGIRSVVQMRIERDWSYHVQHRLEPYLERFEDNAPSPEEIVAKLLATMPSHEMRLYIVCDEAALPRTKNDIRASIQEKFGVEIFMKSDFLEGAILDQLTLLELSILDFEMAAAAERFIGTSRSTFSNLATLERFARGAAGGDYIYNLPGSSLATRTDHGAFASARLASAPSVWAPELGFELGQILLKAVDPQRALEQFSACSVCSSDPEERSLSLYNAAKLKAELNFSPAEVIDTYERAACACPERAEPLYGGASYARSRNLFAEAYNLASRGKNIDAPERPSFFEPWIYEWALLDEFSIAASWTGHNFECLQACLELLSCPSLPEYHKARVLGNAKFSADQMAVHLRA